MKSGEDIASISLENLPIGRTAAGASDIFENLFVEQGRYVGMKGMPKQ
jgi:hypothetical protein